MRGFELIPVDSLGTFIIAGLIAFVFGIMFAVVFLKD